ncbi:MAG: ABC transporter permease, partial [Deltaproteobacteria bacterium]|nr:ABC transporter permease [Deltaproteobacteria bacterium]
MPAKILAVLARALLTVFLLTGGVFVAMRLTGDPARLILGPEAEEPAIEKFRESRGLDRPLPEQYLRYIRDLAALDFGDSYVTGLPVKETFFAALIKTLRLMIPTALATLSIGVPLGVWAALVRGRSIDRGLTIFSVLGYAVPNFVFGMLLITIF